MGFLQRRSFAAARPSDGTAHDATDDEPPTIVATTSDEDGALFGGPLINNLAPLFAAAAAAVERRRLQEQNENLRVQIDQLKEIVRSQMASPQPAGGGPGDGPGGDELAVARDTIRNPGGAAPRSQREDGPGVGAGLFSGPPVNNIAWLFSSARPSRVDEPLAELPSYRRLRTPGPPPTPTTPTNSPSSPWEIGPPCSTPPPPRSSRRRPSPPLASAKRKRPSAFVRTAPVLPSSLPSPPPGASAAPAS